MFKLFIFSLTLVSTIAQGGTICAGAIMRPITTASGSAYQAAIVAMSPYGYWRLGESSGTSAADLSGSSRNGTYTGGFTLGSAGAIPGDPDTSVTLDGTTGYIITTAALVVTAGDFTYCTWFRPTSVSGITQTIYSSGYSLNDTPYINMFQNDNFVRVYSPDSGIFIDSAATLTANVWHLAVLTRSGDTWSLYVDGASAVTGTASGAYLLVNQAAAGILYRNTTSSFFTGRLDEVAVWRRAITSGEVATIWGFH